MGGIGISFLSGDGSDVHDAPAALPHHHRQRRLAAVEDGAEIAFEHAGPLIRLHIGQKRIVMKTGVVHQHLEAADLLNSRLPRVGIGDFEGDELGTAFGALHESGGTLTPLTHAEVDNGFRLVGEEKLGDGEAEGSVGSGDEDVSRHGKVVF